MYNIVKENQKLFIELAKVLNAKGANIEMESCFIGEEFVTTNVPEVRGYMGPEGDGFYFRANHKYFGISEIEIAELFPITIDGHIFRMISFSEFEIEFTELFPINIDGYNFRMVSFSDYEVEFDGDRSYPESVSFIIEKEGKNILS